MDQPPFVAHQGALIDRRLDLRVDVAGREQAVACPLRRGHGRDVRRHRLEIGPAMGTDDGPRHLQIAVAGQAGEALHEEGHGSAKIVLDLAGERGAVTSLELGASHLGFGAELSAAARARALAKVLAIDDRNRDPSFGQGDRRAESSIARADDDHVGVA